MPRLITDARRMMRLESDVDSLPFPRGGVHGTPSPTSDRMKFRIPFVAEEVQRTLSEIESHMDRLRKEMDETLSDSWPPRAA